MLYRQALVWTSLAITIFAASLVRTTAQTSASKVDVLTNRYDILRSGANLRETILETKNVCQTEFGKIFSREVDGDIYAQPLVKTNVNIPNVGSRDVVYVATVNNSLYAFDAESSSVSKPYWHVTSQVLGQPVPKKEVTDLPPDQEYRNFDNNVGIVATPVIDDQTSTIYVVAFSKDAGAYHFRLHAFDLATGREKREMQSPAEIEASYLGNGAGNVDGRIRFSPRKMLNRPGLLLLNGVIYLAFTSHLDGEPKFEGHGWIMAFDAKTLRQLGALCSTPDGIQGGIWQSGVGLSADTREGAPYPLIYAVVANGTVGGRNFGQSILQVYPAPFLGIKQAYTPPEQAYQNDQDLDLSTGPVLFPDLPFVLGCSKDGKCYLVDRANMRLIQEFQAGSNSYGGVRPANIHGAPVYWRDQNHNLQLYVWGEEDFLRSFQFNGRRFEAAPKSTMRAPENSMPGGILSLSANGSAAGSAVVWASVPISGDANMGTVPGILRAFDASNVQKELWNSEQAGERDHLGLFAKFCPPVVANGKIYMATFGGKLVVYGLLEKSKATLTSGQ
jgi:outer membrane protein assembly factor BamB